MDKKPDPSPASIYLLKRFVELNEVHQEALDKLKPGLWSRLIAAVHDKVNPFDVEDELLTTLNEQGVCRAIIYFIPISNYYFLLC